MGTPPSLPLRSPLRRTSLLLGDRLSDPQGELLSTCQPSSPPSRSPMSPTPPSHSSRGSTGRPSRLSCPSTTMPTGLQTSRWFTSRTRLLGLRSSLKCYLFLFIDNTCFLYNEK